MSLLLQCYTRCGSRASTRTCLFTGSEFEFSAAEKKRDVTIANAVTDLIAPLTRQDFETAGASPDQMLNDADISLVFQSEPHISTYLVAQRREGAWQDLTGGHGAEPIDGLTLYGDILGALSTLIEHPTTAEREG